MPPRAGYNPLANAWWQDATPLPKTNSSRGPIGSLYVHIPFCATKCPYCDFNSHAGRDAEIPSYAEALARELGGWRPALQCQTLFMGGGTPTYGTVAQLQLYVDAIGRQIELAPDYEWTVESNPGSLDPAKAQILKHAGVNRVSIGAQSFSQVHLDTLGRTHTAGQTAQAVNVCRTAGLADVSLDLILAIPGQSLRDQRMDLESAISLEPDHVSAYVLTYEPGTRFTRWATEGRLPGPDSDRELAHLELACQMLGAAGYERYEISNFARGGQVCQHNLAYWRMEDWIGIGAGAHSHVGGRRWKLVDDPTAYAEGIGGGALPIAFEELSTSAERMMERYMMGLRLSEGVDLKRAARDLGIGVVMQSASLRASLQSRDLLTVSGDRLRTTPRGRSVLNSILLELVPEPDARSAP